jgi:predicted Na+-dependent transporter
MIQFMTERMLPFTLTLSIQIFAVSSMLMVGLRYTIGELARPLRDISGVAIALVKNFVLVPLLAKRGALASGMVPDGESCEPRIPHNNAALGV